MDIVVLHLYPYDIIPVLALAAGCDSIKNTLCQSCGSHLLGRRKRCAFHCASSEAMAGFFNKPAWNIPGPFSDSSNSIGLFPVVDYFEAKRNERLGYDSDVVLLLTIATPFKYSATGQIGFLDLVTPVLEEFPKAVLIAVGPDDEGAWQSAKIRTNGRIVALGKRWDNDLLYAAADIYLDSVPFSSITSF